MKRLLLILMVIWFAGCAGVPPELQKWSNETKAKAQAGEVQWSVYYKELFNRLSAANFPAKGVTLERVNTLIVAAQGYEQGNITKEQFESVQRSMIAQQEATRDAARAQQARAIGNALEDYGNNVYGPQATRNRQIQTPTYTPPPNLPPRQTNCQVNGNQVDCISNR